KGLRTVQHPTSGLMAPDQFIPLAEQTWYGYSSLAYLKRLPVDELKIDRSFVQHMATGGADAIIVRSTVDLAHSFGLRVVAEGVEDEATLHLLTALHCDLAQGYYLSRPIPAQELECW